MKTFAIGDIHGNHEGLKQCLERSKFDKEHDKLVVLGDTCDGRPFVKQCFDELLSIRNLIYVMGNHDHWALDWFMDVFIVPGVSEPEKLWTRQGGQATIDSYLGKKMDEAHIKLLDNALAYYVDGKKLFVHGGIDERKPVQDHQLHELFWDRDMLRRAVMIHPVNPDYKFQHWDAIFIGHTTTHIYGTNEPLEVCNVIDLDTGAGFNGKLTIMDYNSGEFWQSDTANELYPNIKGR